MTGRKYFLALLVAGVCFLQSAGAFAADGQKEVLWNKQVVYAVEQEDGRRLADDKILQQLGLIIDKKLRSLAAAGKLPFKTVVPDVVNNTDLRARMEENQSVALVPIVLGDTNTEHKFRYEQYLLHKYEVRTDLALLFCGFKDGNFVVLYNVPLSCYASLGSSLQEALLEPLSLAELQQQYLANAEQLVDELVFPENMGKYLHADYALHHSYRIDEVQVGQEVQQKLPGELIENVAKPVLASVYTHLLAAKHPDMIMLPSKVSGESWKRRVVQHLSKATDIAFSEEQDAVLPISLEFSYINSELGFKNKYSSMADLSYEVQLSDLTNKKRCVYRAGYKLPKDLSFSLEVNWMEIFSDAAAMLAESK